VGKLAMSVNIIANMVFGNLLRFPGMLTSLPGFSHIVRVQLVDNYRIQRSDTNIGLEKCSELLENEITAVTKV
jgi:hypothetical protein